MLEWLFREEITLLIGALGALGCLTLGVLELLWPTGARRAARPRTVSVTQPPQAAAPSHASAPPRRISTNRLVAVVELARAETDPARRTTALRVAILTLERWRAGGAPLDPAAVAALDRARAELWADYQRIAFRRLAATTPSWRASALRAADGGR